MKVLSNWRSVRLWESHLEQRLHRRHSLRIHGLLIGSATLLVMWGVSALVRTGGVDSLALRYLFTLGTGYLCYLGMLRWWGGRLAEREGRASETWSDAAEVAGQLAPDFDLPARPVGALRPGGQAGTTPARSSGEPHGATDHGSGFDLGSLGDLGELAGGADEGAVVVVPVLALFLIGVVLLTGTGSLVLLYFGSEVLLAVTLEIAFSYVAARAAVRLAREGWLRAAVRLTWKPLLGTVACAVLLGAFVDRFVPGAQTLPHAIRIVMGRG
ncbi:MAG: hypothetical protein EOO24_05200 [Comamonadaceae bacterium]|nr:MAG: hypothetical protein EOO24_05200 [Comamonadaceae bacterium]